MICELCEFNKDTPPLGVNCGISIVGANQRNGHIVTGLVSTSKSFMVILHLVRYLHQAIINVCNVSTHFLDIKRHLPGVSPSIYHLSIHIQLKLSGTPGPRPIICLWHTFFNFYNPLWVFWGSAIVGWACCPLPL